MTKSLMANEKSLLRRTQVYCIGLGFDVEYFLAELLPEIAVLSFPVPSESDRERKLSSDVFQPVSSR